MHLILEVENKEIGYVEICRRYDPISTRLRISRNGSDRVTAIIDANRLRHIDFSNLGYPGNLVGRHL